MNCLYGYPMNTEAFSHWHSPARAWQVLPGTGNVAQTTWLSRASFWCPGAEKKQPRFAWDLVVPFNSRLRAKRVDMVLTSAKNGGIRQSRPLCWRSPGFATGKYGTCSKVFSMSSVRPSLDQPWLRPFFHHVACSEDNPPGVGVLDTDSPVRSWWALLPWFQCLTRD